VFGSRRKDAEALCIRESSIAPFYPVRAPSVNRGRRMMAGNVIHVYQRARRGSKVLIDFGAYAGCWDTWWEGSVPASRCWVLVECHLWTPPGTHSGGSVLWIDNWLGQWPKDTMTRALRYQRRLERATQKRKRI
jgi:hypothetical protein